MWLQGAWFYAVGFILYPPSGWTPWDPESHHHGMMVTMLFTWHAAGVMGSMMLLAGLIYRWENRARIQHKGFARRLKEEDKVCYYFSPHRGQHLLMQAKWFVFISRSVLISFQKSNFD